MKLPAELKTKWVEALRSGEYDQTVGALKTRVYRDDSLEAGIGYCCLGVLCEVAGLEFNPSSSDHTLVVSGLAGKPGPVGYASMGVEIDLMDIVEEKLVYLNDEKRASFATIADYIEANVEVL